MPYGLSGFLWYNEDNETARLCGMNLRGETRMYRNIIFDLYGTLVDIRTDEASLNFWRKAVSVFARGKASYSPSELMRSYRRYVRRERLHEQLSHPTVRYLDIDLLKVFRRLYADKGVHADDELLQDTAHRFRKASTEKLRLYDGAKDLLDALKQANRKIYLLSNAQESFTVPELKELGIYDYFDGILISSEERICKPQKAFFDRLIERYRLNRKECIMVGNDQYADMRGAYAAGIDGLYIYQEISPPVKDEKEIRAKWKIMDGDVRKIIPCLLDDRNEG